MGLRLYNTASRSVQPFSPQDPGRVGIYACGPTLYGPAHIGNFRTFLLYDLVHRYLEWRGYGVHFVMNFTDVDDKTIAAARAQGATLADYTPGLREAGGRGGRSPRGPAFRRVPEGDRLHRPDGSSRRTASRAWTGIRDAPTARSSSGSRRFPITAHSPAGIWPGRERASASRATTTGRRTAATSLVWKGVKEGDREAGAAWSAPWGEGRPGWAPRVLRHGAFRGGRHGRPASRRGGPDLPAPRGRNRAVRGGDRQALRAPVAPCEAPCAWRAGRCPSRSATSWALGRSSPRVSVPRRSEHLLISAHYRTELNFTEGRTQGLPQGPSTVSSTSILASGPTRSGPAGRSSGVGEASESALTSFREALD